ncbi:MAG TPA: glutamyl-tRNA reductase [Thermodesulfobacteriota bacterium]|nr:glutamyl-tRNA reductase [Thermodesulfobacteriota bacterium]
MMQIVVVGLSHKTAPVEIRECFSFHEPAFDVGLEELHKKRSIEECLILSTCNRVEVYAVSEDAETCAEDIKRFLSEFHDVKEEHFSSYFYTLTGRSAVRHLFRVASSLDSMVIGEPQILGQVKEAFRVAANKGTVRLILNRLFHTAFFVAKKVRAETGIGTQSVSVSYVAVELAKRIFDDLSRRTVMLIGAGDMAELAARHLIKAGIRELIIASRRRENAKALADVLNGKAVKMEEVYYLLKEADIVITATGSADFVIRPQHVREALKLRKNEPMFMIDIAVPRDIDPRIEEIPNVYLYDIDDLKAVLDDNMKTRRENAEKAEEVVLEGERHFLGWLDALKVFPTIIELKRRFDDIKAMEIEKALRRLGNFSDREKKIIESMASGIIGKILHNPLMNLKKESSTSLGALYVDAINRLFRLEGEFELYDEGEDEAITKDWK